MKELLTDTTYQLLGLSFISFIIPLLLFLFFNKKSKQNLFLVSKWVFLLFSILTSVVFIYLVSYAIKETTGNISISDGFGTLFAILIYFYYYPFVLMGGFLLSVITDFIIQFSIKNKATKE